LAGDGIPNKGHQFMSSYLRISVPVFCHGPGRVIVVVAMVEKEAGIGTLEKFPPPVAVH